MFGSVGFTEILVLFIIALLIFGPRKLPEIARSVGQAMREFKKAGEEVARSIEEPVDDLRQRIQQTLEFDEERQWRY
ncbi:MAG: twin-arginine translocase TatA/TatE family subunit [Armatimonadota bacterium]|nr:twin-arginine translocase TatA/TatE family subunit [Armatimonadota bacterium]